MGLIVAAVELLVSILIIRWLLNQKANEKFSRPFVRKTLILGFVSTIVTLVIGLTISDKLFPASWNLIFRAFVMILVTAGLLEEIVKYILFRLAIRNSDEVKTIHDAMIASALVAVGFSMFENVEYSVFGDLSTLARVLFPIHILFGTVMGYFYGKAKSTGQKKYHFLSLFVPVMLHTIYDTPIAIIKLISTDPVTNEPLADEVIEQGPYGAYTDAFVYLAIGVALVFLAMVIVSCVKIHKGKTDPKLQVLLVQG